MYNVFRGKFDFAEPDRVDAQLSPAERVSILLGQMQRACRVLDEIYDWHIALKPPRCHVLARKPVSLHSHGPADRTSIPIFYTPAERRAAFHENYGRLGPDDPLDEWIKFALDGMAKSYYAYMQETSDQGI
jgi:hypothetical protein